MSTKGKQQNILAINDKLEPFEALANIKIRMAYIILIVNFSIHGFGGQQRVIFNPNIEATNKGGEQAGLG